MDNKTNKSKPVSPKSNMLNRAEYDNQSSSKDDAVEISAITAGNLNFETYMVNKNKTLEFHDSRRNDNLVLAMKEMDSIIKQLDNSDLSKDERANLNNRMSKIREELHKMNSDVAQDVKEESQQIKEVHKSTQKATLYTSFLNWCKKTVKSVLENPESLVLVCQVISEIREGMKNGSSTEFIDTTLTNDTTTKNLSAK